MSGAAERPAATRGWTLITGASSGLGVEFARIAARGGHRLILSARSEDKLQALARELGDKVSVEVIPADLSKPGAAARLWDAACDGREIDILVNNAGLGHKGGLGAALEKESDMVAVNVTAATELMGRAVVAMRTAGRGHVLNVASVAGYMPGPRMAVYHATKAYLLSLSQAASFECDDTGVSVTALCPGPVETGFFEVAGLGDGPGGAAGRPAKASDVAQTGWEAMLAGRRVVVPGAMMKLVAATSGVVPTSVLAAMVTRSYSAD